MIPLILLAGAVVVGAGLVATFWNSIISWINRAAEKVNQVIKGTVQGVKIFVKKMGEAYKEITRHFSKNGSTWEETIVSRNASPNEIPSEIRERAPDYVETDITNDLELQLSH